MHESVAVTIILSIVFIGIVFIIKITSDNRVRRKLIESGNVNENVTYLYSPRRNVIHFSSLKWGMILIGIGLAIIVGQLFPGYEGPIMISCMFLFSGMGLVLYYYFTEKKANDSKKNEAKQTLSGHESEID